jgi:hypothetical protein
MQRRKRASLLKECRSITGTGRHKLEGSPVGGLWLKGK